MINNEIIRTGSEPSNDLPHVVVVGKGSYFNSGFRGGPIKGMVELDLLDRPGERRKLEGGQDEEVLNG